MTNRFPGAPRRRRPSKLAAAITAAFLLGGAVVVVLAVRGVLADTGDDASWVAIGLGVALAAWGVSFHRLGEDESEDEDEGEDGPRPDRTDRFGVVATIAVVGTGAYLVTRSLLGHSMTAAVAVAAVTVGLSALNKWLDAVLARRKGGRGDGGTGPDGPVLPAD